METGDSEGPGIPVAVLVRPRNGTIGYYSANQRLGGLIGLYLRAPDSAILYCCHIRASYYVSSSRLRHFATSKLNSFKGCNSVLFIS